MIIKAVPDKVQARDLRNDDVIVAGAEHLDRVVDVDVGTLDVRVEFYRSRISGGTHDFAVHEDPLAVIRFRPDAWVRIVRLEVKP